MAGLCERPRVLSLYIFQKPRKAKKLYFGVIPRAVDEYLSFLDAYQRQDWKNRLGNPVWHIHAGEPPAPETVAAQGENAPRAQISFAMLLNLVAVANTDDPEVLWGFIRRYAPSLSPDTHPRLAKLVGYAARYFEDFVKPQKTYRLADDVERSALQALDEASLRSKSRATPATPEEIQEKIYDVGRSVPRYQDLKAKTATPERPGVSQDWFNAIYQILLGEERGPRFGSSSPSMALTIRAS